MKKTLLTSLFALAVSAAFVSAGMAETKQAPQTTLSQGTKMEKFSGVVERIDVAHKDVLVEFHKDKRAFSLDDHAKIMKGSKEISLADLKKGMWASVEYKKEGDKQVAESMRVSMLKMMPKKEAPSAMKKGSSSEKTVEMK